MRILHVTDFHFRRPWFEWLARRAPEFDLCCFTGDWLDMFPSAKVGLHEQSRWVRAWLKDFPIRLYGCTGNHDWWQPSEFANDNDALGGWLRKARRSLVAVDGASELHDGYHFVCCPWAGAPQAPGPAPAIVLVHAPPLRSPVASDSGWEAGDPDVADAIPRLPPHSLLLCGHVHQPARWCVRIGSTWCFNPGVDFSATVPNHIIIDTTVCTADAHGWGKTLHQDL
ncbi:MAG: metallophosphoesterase family protein [Verrucomicrobiota bacterium]